MALLQLLCQLQGIVVHTVQVGRKQVLDLVGLKMADKLPANILSAWVLYSIMGVISQVGDPHRAPQQ